MLIQRYLRVTTPNERADAVTAALFSPPSYVFWNIPITCQSQFRVPWVRLHIHLQGLVNIDLGAFQELLTCGVVYGPSCTCL